MTDAQSVPSVVDLADGCTDSQVVGGKGASLSRLHDAGLRVPPGFCVTTAVFDDISDRITPGGGVPTDSISIAQATERRTRLLEEGLPDAVSSTIAERVREYGADAFVVRSSAVDEDGAATSFAGQHESYVNVAPGRVPERVLDCMASLYAERAVQYRVESDVSVASLRMAVVVQPLVDGEVSGVLSTADPVTGNRTVGSIESTYGLAAGVVDGTQPTDTITFDRSTGRILSVETAAKTETVRAAPDRDGTTTTSVAEHLRDEATLTADDIGQLRSIADTVESVFDYPQDVEWTIADGTCYVLQSRPLTSLFPVPEPAPGDGVHVYLSMGHQQVMTRPLPPLVRDIWRAWLENAADRFRPSADGAFAVEAGGRVYVDITSFLRLPPLRERVLKALAEITEPGAEGLRTFLEAPGTDIGTSGPLRGRLRILAALWRGRDVVGPMVGSSARSVLRTVAFGPPDIEDQWEWTDSLGQELCQPLRNRHGVDAKVDYILSELDVLQLVGRGVPHIAMYRVGLLAERFLEWQFPREWAAIDDLTVGFEDEVVARMHRELAALREVESETQPGTAPSNAGGPPADDPRLAAFLDRFGHRTGRELDLSEPRWRDDPTALPTTAGGADPEQLRQRWTAARDALRSEIRNRPLGRLRAGVIDRAIEAYRSCLQLREFPKHGIAHLFAAVHDTVRQAGDQLAQQGAIDEPADVWFLRSAELQRALDGASDIDPPVATRRVALDRFAKLDPPPLLTSDGERLERRREAESDDTTTLRGTPVSPGTVEGSVRVVVDPDTATIEPGEILVAAGGDPGWTLLFPEAAGVVFAVGGRLTHGALVAREYGLPAVASVPAATSTLRTGERVRLDGTNGTVHRLDDEAE